MWFRNVFADAAAIAAIRSEHVVDFAEGGLWKSPFGREGIELICPALVVFFGSCGGTPVEAANAVRGDFRTKGDSRLYLRGHRHLFAREVPAIELARIKLQSYVSTQTYSGDNDALFRNADGRPLTVTNVFGYFASLGERIGLDGSAIPAALRGAFLRWSDGCDTERVRTYLRGNQLRGRRGLPPLPDPAPEKVAIELRNAHPLANLDRDELKAPGAAARAYPDPHFPKLSRAARSDLSVARKGNTSLSEEVVRAIRTSSASGKRPGDIAARYVLSENTVRRYLAVPDGGGPEARPKLGQPSFLKVMLDRVSDVPGSTPESLAAYLNETFGSCVKRTNVYQTARDNGVELSFEPRRTPWRRHEDALRSRLTMGPPASLDDVVEWFAARGIATKRTTLEYGLTQLDLFKYLRKTGKGSRQREAFGSAWPTIRRWILADPSIPYRRLAERLEGEMEIAIPHETLRQYVSRMPDKPPKKPKYGPSRSSASATDRPEIATTRPV